jgi:hypothetical protein
MENKLMLKDYVGKRDINIMIDANIKGQKYDRETIKNERLLKNVFIKTDKKGNQWLYVEWQPKDKFILGDKSTCIDCGYSGLMLGDSHNLNGLYVMAV